MKVRNKKDNREYEAIKHENGTYTVNNVQYNREQMSELFVPIKESKKVDKVESEPEIIRGECGHEGDIGGLALALSKCQGEFTAVKKASSGHGYDYANIEDVLRTCLPITSKYELAPTQMNLTMTANNIHYTGVRTYIIHSSGGLIYSDMYMPTEKSKMNSLVQMAGGIVTYLRRYGIQSALGLATTDNDGSDK